MINLLDTVSIVRFSVNLYKHLQTSPVDSELEARGTSSLQFLEQYKTVKDLDSFVSKEVLKTIMSCQPTCGFNLCVQKESSASRVVTTAVSSFLAEQEDTQKKTFTCWVNSQLAKVRTRVTFSCEDRWLPYSRSSYPRVAHAWNSSTWGLEAGGSRGSRPALAM